MLKPQRRTRKRRENHAATARKYLLEFQRQIRPDDNDSLGESRVMRLLWAEAEIHRLLALETQGALGDVYATATGVQKIHAAEKARVARTAVMAVGS